MSQTGCRCDRLLPYSRHEQAQEKKLLESIEVAKGLLKNFIDIDDVISPKGRQPFYVPPEVAKPKPAPGFSLPHPDVPARERPTWCNTIKIGNAMWSLADLDYVDCEDIDRPGSGIKFYRGVYYYTEYAAKRIVDKGAAASPHPLGCG